MKKFIIAFLTTPLLISTLISPAKANGLDLTPISFQSVLCSNRDTIFTSLQQHTLPELLAIDPVNFYGIRRTYQLLDGTTPIDDPIVLTSSTLRMSESHMFDRTDFNVENLGDFTNLKMQLTTAAIDANGDPGAFAVETFDIPDIYEAGQVVGLGTASEPYLVNTPEQFSALRCLDIDNRERDRSDWDRLHVEITSDLQMSESVFIPFSVRYAKIDGNNHTISNLQTFGHRTGMFADTNDSSFKNLNFRKIQINGGLGVGIFGNYCNNVEFENIKVTFSDITALNGGTICNDVDRAHFKNIEVDSTFNIIANDIDSAEFRENIPSMYFEQGIGGLVGEASSSMFENVNVKFKVQSGMGILNHSSEILANNLMDLTNIGGLFGRSTDDVNVEHSSIDFTLDFAGANRARNIGGVTGNALSVLLQNVKAVTDISLTNPTQRYTDETSNFDSIGGLVGREIDSSIFGSSVTGNIDITASANISDWRISHVGSIWGYTEEDLLVQRVRADVDISMAVPNVSAVGAIGGRWRIAWLKDVAVHSDLNVSTSSNECDEFGVGAFAGEDGGLGRVERVVATGNISLQTSCSKSNLSGTFGYSRSESRVFWNNSYWNSSTDSDLGTRTDPANGVGATTNQLKTRKFFNAKEYDFKKIWTMDSKTGFATLRPNKGYTSTALKAQSSKQGLIGFSNLASDSRRTYKINLPSSDAGKSATIRIRGTGSAKSLKRVKLNRQGDATFMSNVTLNVGDLLQLVVDKKVRVKLLLK